jgi:hypothetical protein
VIVRDGLSGEAMNLDSLSRELPRNLATKMAGDSADQCPTHARRPPLHPFDLRNGVRRISSGQRAFGDWTRREESGWLLDP